MRRARHWALWGWSLAAAAASLGVVLAASVWWTAAFFGDGCVVWIGGGVLGVVHAPGWDLSGIQSPTPGLHRHVATIFTNLPSWDRVGGSSPFTTVRFPLWIPLLFAGAGSAGCALRARRLTRAAGRAAGACRSCGYEGVGAGRCPECGRHAPADA